MIESIWTFVEPYVYVPSAVYVVLTLFVYMTWLFGTDWYDSFKKQWRYSLDFMKRYFWITLAINAIGFLFTEELIYAWAAFNLWCLLLLLLYSIRLTHRLLTSFNKWCLTKRGKI